MRTIMFKQKWLTGDAIAMLLGVIWCLDGLLQLQPRMFTSAFATNVIAQAAQGQPAFVANPMRLFMHLFLINPIIANTVIAIMQLAIGGLILFARTRRWGLIVSVAWSVFVWYIGEGLSGIASGHAMLLMGSPGAAFIYGALALALLYGRVDNGIRRPASWTAYIWIAVWVVGACFQVLPGQNTVADSTAMIRANSVGAPAWLARVDNGFANVLAGFGTAATAPISSMAGMPGMGAANAPASNNGGSETHNVPGFWLIALAAMVELGIGLGVLASDWVCAITLGCGVVIAAVFWVVGQSLGGYYTGLATDPSTGPLLILLGLAVVASSPKQRHHGSVLLSRLWGRFKAEMAAFNEA